MQRDGGDQRSFLDLSQFKLDAHVERAIDIALTLSEGLPLNAAHVLNSAIIVNPENSSPAFSKWASLFPPFTEGYISRGGSQSRRKFNSIPVNSFLAASFEAAKPFFHKKDEFWGRDYITLALLAVGDTSLNEIAIAANRSIQSLRDEWFLFVASDRPYGEHRPWEQWWQKRGLRFPREATEVAIPEETGGRKAIGAYLLTWDPKRHPAGDFAEEMAALETRGTVVMQWSVGSHSIKRGDRVFFMRHGPDMPGLIGSGHIESDITEGPHWDRTMPAHWTSSYADVRWEILSEFPLIPLEELVKRTGEDKLWIETGSGLPIPAELAQKLETLWKQALLSRTDVNSSVARPNEQAALAMGAAAATGSSSPAVVHPQGQQPPTITPKQEEPKPTVAPVPPASASRLPDVWVLSDRPLEDRFAQQDRFQFKDYANALAAVLDHEKTETPFTMAINAPWGAGKTTLANMIAEQLRQRPKDRGQAPHIICWFNAWMHDDAPNLATAFISEVGRTADLSRSLLTRIFNPLPLTLLEPSSRKWRQLILGVLILMPTIVVSSWVAAHLQRVDRYKRYEAAKVAVGQTITTVTKDASGKNISSSEADSQPRKYPMTPAPPEPLVPTGVDQVLDALQSRLVLLGAFFTALAGLLGLLAKIFTSTPLGSFVQSPDKTAEAGAIRSAEKQLAKLISQARWRGNRFIVFVDDIERCKPPRSVEILDAVNQLMSHKGVVVVFLGDMSAVAAAAQLKYKDLAEIFVPSAGIALTGPDRAKEAFGRLYLQKIVQFQFDLPVPPMNRIREYLRHLAVAPEPQGNRDGRH